jgi:hypothetical protein
MQYLNAHRSSRRVSDLKFLDRFSENIQILNLKKIRPVGAEDGHKDMTKLTVALSSFANATKNRINALCRQNVGLLNVKSDYRSKGESEFYPITGHEGPEGE